MTQWIEQYKNFTDSGTWKQVLEHANTAKFDKIEDINLQGHGLRFKRTIIYLANIIESMDPEFVPVSVWQQLQGDINSCASYLPPLDDNISVNASAYQNVNSMLDQLLTRFLPFVVPIGSQSAKAAGQAFRSYAKTIKDSLAVADKQRNEIQALKNDLENFRDDFIGDTEYEKDDEESSLKERFIAVYEDLAKKTKEIEEFYSRLVKDTPQGEPSIISDIGQKKKAADAASATLQNYIQALEAPVKELQKFYSEVVGKKNEEGQYVGGLLDELNKRKEALQSFEDEQKNKYKEIVSQIDGLISGATSAGLASAFEKQKQLKAAEKEKYERYFVWCVGGIFAIIVSVFYLEYSVSEDGTFISGLYDPLHWAVRGPLMASFLGPILWLAIVFSKRRSENSRLHEEYAHKEALSKSVYSYKKQIDALKEDNEQLLTLLLKEAVTAISENPSKTLDGKHGDNPPAVDLINKNVRGSGAGQ